MKLAVNSATRPSKCVFKDKRSRFWYLYVRVCICVFGCIYIISFGKGQHEARGELGDPLFEVRPQGQENTVFVYLCACICVSNVFLTFRTEKARMNLVVNSATRPSKCVFPDKRTRCMCVCMYTYMCICIYVYDYAWKTVL